jgi:hypothetical protein
MSDGERLLKSIHTDLVILTHFHELARPWSNVYNTDTESCLGSYVDGSRSIGELLDILPEIYGDDVMKVPTRPKSPL